MASTRRPAQVLIALFIMGSTASCTVTTTTRTGPARPDDAVFLEALSGPIRAKYPDSTLIAEGQKACDAFAQGQSEDQVEKMIAADLDVDSGQFIGAVYGGLNCYPKSHPSHGGN